MLITLQDAFPFGHLHISERNLIAAIFKAAIQCRVFPVPPHNGGLLIKQLQEFCAEEFELSQIGERMKWFESPEELYSWLAEKPLKLREVRRLGLTGKEVRGRQSIDKQEKCPTWMDQAKTLDEDAVNMANLHKRVYMSLVCDDMNVSYFHFGPS